MMILQEHEEVREKLLKRIVYDKMGDKEWVVPLPEFSTAYETMKNSTKSIKKLNPPCTGTHQKHALLGGWLFRRSHPKYLGF